MANRYQEAANLYAAKYPIGTTTSLAELETFARDLVKGVNGYAANYALAPALSNPDQTKRRAQLRAAINKGGEEAEVPFFLHLEDRDVGTISILSDAEHRIELASPIAMLRKATTTAVTAKKLRKGLDRIDTADLSEKDRDDLEVRKTTMDSFVNRGETVVKEFGNDMMEATVKRLNLPPTIKPLFLEALSQNSEITRSLDRIKK